MQSNKDSNHTMQEIRNGTKKMRTHVRNLEDLTLQELIANEPMVIGHV